MSRIMMMNDVVMVVVAVVVHVLVVYFFLNNLFARSPISLIDTAAAWWFDSCG